MLLVIDNYDSFTYNLVQYFGELGAEIKVVRNDAMSIDEIRELAPERICISPGPCTPNEAGISCDVIREFGQNAKQPTPILGVCLGHQSIGQVLEVKSSAQITSCMARHPPFSTRVKVSSPAFLARLPPPATTPSSSNAIPCPIA